MTFSDHLPEFKSKAFNKGHKPDQFIINVIEKEPNFKKLWWEEPLRKQVKDLPAFDDVFRDLKKHLRNLEKVQSQNKV